MSFIGPLLSSHRALLVAGEGGMAVISRLTGKTYADVEFPQNSVARPLVMRGDGGDATVFLLGLALVVLFKV